MSIMNGKSPVVTKEKSIWNEAPNFRDANSCILCKYFKCTHCCGCCPSEYACSLYDCVTWESSICDSFTEDEEQ